MEQRWSIMFLFFGCFIVVFPARLWSSPPDPLGGSWGRAPPKESVVHFKAKCINLVSGGWIYKEWRAARRVSVSVFCLFTPSSSSHRCSHTVVRADNALLCHFTEFKNSVDNLSQRSIQLCSYYQTML